MRTNNILLYFVSTLLFVQEKNINTTKASLYPSISILSLKVGIIPKLVCYHINIYISILSLLTPLSIIYDINFFRHKWHLNVH